MKPGPNNGRGPTDPYPPKDGLNTLATQPLEKHAVSADENSPPQPPGATEAYIRLNQASINLEDALWAAARPSET